MTDTDTKNPDAERINEFRNGLSMVEGGQWLLPLFDDLVKALAQSQPPDNQFVPGVMHCAKCKLRIVRTNLYVKSGTTGPGDSNTEPCPNGCGPLWPVTWKQEAQEAIGKFNETWEELEKEGRNHEKTIEQRDDAENCINDIFYRIVGESAQWSNLFGYEQAKEEINDRVDALRAAVSKYMPTAAPKAKPPEDIAGWKSGKLFEDILRRRLGTASANDQTVETQHIIYGTELCALASILDQLSEVKEECLLTIDRMNAEKSKPPEQGHVDDYKFPSPIKISDIECALYTFRDHKTVSNAELRELVFAAQEYLKLNRRYSELARGKGGG